jgi:hypothetical protein
MSEVAGSTLVDARFPCVVVKMLLQFLQQVLAGEQPESIVVDDFLTFTLARLLKHIPLRISTVFLQ